MATKTKTVPRKDKICVWTFPEGSEPAVRVTVECGRILCEELLKIVARTLDVFECNLQFFGLFRGIERPTKKYGLNEYFYLPCRDIISFQRWSFDIIREKNQLCTDAGAMHLLCIQSKADIEAGRIKVKPEQLPLLQEHSNPQFPCDKQFVELCQTMYGYATVRILNCKLQNDLKVKELRLEEGSDLSLVAAKRGMVFKSGKTVFFAPWRKIRRWSQVQGNSIHFEIYFAEELSFEWVEVETDQAQYLIAVISEMVYMMQQEEEGPQSKMSKLGRFIPRPKLTWKLIKSELFKKDDEQDDDLEPPEFDDWQADASSDDESSDEEGQKYPRAASARSLRPIASSKKSSGYRV